MRKYTILIFMIGLIACTNSNRESPDFIYNIKFIPSFTYNSDVEIVKSGSVGKLKLKIYKDKFLTQEFLTDSVELTRDDLENFSNALKEISLINTKSSNHPVLDGMTVLNIYYEKGKLNYFIFNSPKPGSKYYKIQNVVHELIQQKFKSKIEKDYISELGHYCK